MEWLFAKITDLSEEEYESIYSELTMSRKAHVDRIKPKDGVRRSLLGERLARTLLNKWGADADIERDENGKPYSSKSPFFISISHCEDAVVAAISEEPVGIDIEKLKPVSDALIKRACNEAEIEFIKAAENEGEKSERFFSVWTAKEAYFKKSEIKLPSFLSVDTSSIDKKAFKIEEYFITIV